MNEPELLRVVLDGYALDPIGPHGVNHWGRVYENGVRLATLTGADAAVVRAFAVLHDARRLNDGHDPDHGVRGAALAREVAPALGLNVEQGIRLSYACEAHTFVHRTGIPTVDTCFDADRLDLPRVGVAVDPARLATAEAAQLIPWASERAPNQEAATFIVTQWRIPPERVLPPWGMDILATWRRGAPGFPTLNRFNRAWGWHFMCHTQVQDEAELAALFGRVSAEEFVQAMLWHQGSSPDGSFWFHGCSEATARVVIARGWNLALAGGNRWGGVDPLGHALFLGGPELATLYGPWLIAVCVKAAPVPWDDPRRAAVFASLGLPDDKSALARLPHTERERIRPAMLAAGLPVVRRDSSQEGELIVYAPSLAVPCVALPTRQMASAYGRVSNVPPLVRPSTRAAFPM